MNICILGAGAWGTAMAIHLGRQGHTVTLVTRRIEHAMAMASNRENCDYLPGFVLNDNIQIASEVKPSLLEADVLLMACPSHALRFWCEEVAKHLDSSWRIKLIVTLCKGLERGTRLVPSDVVKQVLPGIAVGVLSGPNYATEVAQGKPTATVLASDAADEGLLKEVQEAMSNETLRVYRSHDLMGVELGGCLKNVYAIGVGCCNGLKLGDNAQAALLTRALHELVRVGVTLGGQKESFYGLSGFGDLIATSTGAWSRNRTFGEEIGQGKKIADLLSHRKTVVEGYGATQVFHEICHDKKIEVPIMDQVHAILYGGKSPQESLHALMTRSLKQECV